MGASEWFLICVSFSRRYGRMLRKAFYKSIKVSEARKLAAAQFGDNFVLLDELVHEGEFGFFFPVTTRKFKESGRLEDLAFGFSGVLVDRKTGDAFRIGSGKEIDYWMEAFRRNLHKSNSVIITKVWHLERAVEALHGLGMAYVIPEYECGILWRIPQFYDQRLIKEALSKLPATFQKQGLIYRLREIEAIEAGDDLEIRLEPMLDPGENNI